MRISTSSQHNICTSARDAAMLGTVIIPVSLWTNQTVESALIFSPIHLILASARWRGEKCRMKINGVRSGVLV